MMTRGWKILLLGVLVGGATVLSGRDGSCQQSEGQSPTGAQGPTASIPRSVDLKRAIDIALRNHPSMTTAEARTLAAKTGVEVTAAQYRPTVRASATVNKTLAGQRGLLVGEEVVFVDPTRRDPFHTASLNLTVPIVREGGLTFMTLPSESAAKAGQEAVASQEKGTRNDVINNVTAAFYGVLSAREEVRVSKLLVELNQLLVENARQRFKQQLIPKAEMLSAETALASAQATHEQAATDLSHSHNDFATALGFSPLSPELKEMELVDEREPLPPVESLQSLLQQATGAHPSVLAQEAIVRQAAANLKSVTSERYPTLGASMNLGEVDDFVAPLERWSLQTGLALNWKIFDFGVLSLKIKQQTENLLAEKHALEQTKNQVTQSVVEAYRNFANTQSTVNSAKKTVELQEEKARAARAQFKQHLIPPSDLLQAESDLAVARKTNIQTEYALRTDHTILQIAVGVP